MFLALFCAKHSPRKFYVSSLKLMQYAYEVDHLLTGGFYTYFTTQADNEKKTNMHIGNVLNIASNALQHATICFGYVPCPRSYFAYATLNLHVLIVIITMMIT